MQVMANPSDPDDITHKVKEVVYSRVLDANFPNRKKWIYLLIYVAYGEMNELKLMHAILNEKEWIRQIEDKLDAIIIERSKK